MCRPCTLCSCGSGVLSCVAPPSGPCSRLWPSKGSISAPSATGAVEVSGAGCRGMAAGSAVWGVVASHTGLPTALLGAAGGLVVGLAALARYRLPPADERDVMATLHWDEPVVA